MSSFFRSFKTGLKYIRRSRFLTFSSVFSMTVSLFLFATFMVVAVFSHFVLKGLEEKAQITAFFKPATGEESILTLEKELKERLEVEKTKYVSQNDALKIYLGQHQNDPTLLESVSSNLLPPSLEIKARKLTYLDGLANELRQRSDVDEVIFFKDVVDTFQKWSSIFRIAAFSLVFLLLIISLIVVLLSVGISVKIRAEEIEIMRLVGATDSQVIGPFIWQGVIYGLMASLISFFFFLGLAGISLPTVKFVASSIPLNNEVFWLISGLAVFHLLLGPILGILSSFLAVKKYLKL